MQLFHVTTLARALEIREAGRFAEYDNYLTGDHPDFEGVELWNLDLVTNRGFSGGVAFTLDVPDEVAVKYAVKIILQEHAGIRLETPTGEYLFPTETPTGEYGFPTEIANAYFTDHTIRNAPADCPLDDELNDSPSVADPFIRRGYLDELFGPERFDAIPDGAVIEVTRPRTMPKFDESDDDETTARYRKEPDGLYRVPDNTPLTLDDDE